MRVYRIGADMKIAGMDEEGRRVANPAPVGLPAATVPEPDGFKEIDERLGHGVADHAQGSARLAG